MAGACRRAAEPAAPAAGAAAPRVASLAPSLTEIICALGAGDRLVGRTDVCNFPPDATARIPIIGSFGKPFLESLLAQRPTDVIEVDLEDESVTDLFTRLGIAHHRIPCQRLADIPPAIRLVGRIVGRNAEAEALAEALAAGLAAHRTAVARTPAADRPLVFVTVWWDPLMTVGRSAFISEVVDLAGGRNLGDELPRDYNTISPEWVLERNPDVILCLTPGTPGTAQARLAGRAGWRELRAVQNGRVLDGFDLDVLSRPGPRVLAAIDQLSRALTNAANRQAGPP
jgi:iron complex transport system substrate-binding protein